MKHKYNLTGYINKGITGILFLLIATLSLFACSPKAIEETVLPKASEYFPIRNNTTYTYQGSGNEFASYTLWTDYSTTNRIQQRIDNGGSSISEVIEIAGDKVIRYYYNAITPAREPLINNQFGTGNEEILLIDPIQQGTTWQLPDGSKRTITSTNTSVTTALDTYETIEVETESSTGNTKQYYAKGVGLIKTIYLIDDGEISSTISGINGNASYKQLVTFYFPLLDKDKIIGITREISFQTNDNTAQIIEQTYRSILEEATTAVLTSNTHIDKIEMVSDTVVHVDISKAYYEELSAGSMAEALIVQSFVNTIGLYYQVNEVILTVGGKPYSTGHFEMKENEPFSVNVTNVIYE